MGVRHGLAICLFFGVWLGVWSAAWLAGVYFFGTETPALFGGFGWRTGGSATPWWCPQQGHSQCVASLKAKNRRCAAMCGDDRRRCDPGLVTTGESAKM